MAVPTVTPLPIPPNRTSGAGEFAPRADIFFGAMPQFQTDMNTLATYSGQQVSLADTARIAAEQAKAAAESARSTVVTRANEVATNTNTVVTRANEVATNTQQVAANTQQVAEDKAAVDAALASIADGPVTSVNGKTGVVTLTAADVGAQPASPSLTAFADKSAPIGAVVGTTDAQTLANKTLTAPAIDRYTLATATTTTLNLATSQVFRIPYAAERTLTFSNVPAANKAMVVVVKLLGAGTVTWPTIAWSEATAPELGAAWTEVVLFWDGAAWSGARRAFE